MKGLAGKAKTPDQLRLLAALNDDVSPAVVKYEGPPGVNPRYLVAIRALMALKPRQRVYCKAILAAAGDRRKARAAMTQRGTPVAPGTISSWFRSQDFVNALQAIKRLALDTAEIDPVSLMLNAGRVVEDALTPKPVTDRNGKVLYEGIDHSAAMKGIEWLGKVQKMTEDEGANRTVLEIVVNLANRDDLEIDVTPVSGEG